MRRLPYIARPNGNDQIPDALVVGMQVGVNF
jgi:carbohydrate-selective porin OprB